MSTKFFDDVEEVQKIPTNHLRLDRKKNMIGQDILHGSCYQGENYRTLPVIYDENCEVVDLFED